MGPAVIMVVGAVALTASGKVDRRALPAPDGSRPDTGREYLAPAGPVQEAIARIWEQVLGLDRVGADDNFFELGGHSLLATPVVLRLAGELDVAALSGAVDDLTGRHESLRTVFGERDGEPFQVVRDRGRG